jgi:hypothetical protein
MPTEVINLPCVSLLIGIVLVSILVVKRQFLELFPLDNLWPQDIFLWGGNKYGLMGKKYHENNARADKKEKKKERTREKKR